MDATELPSREQEEDLHRRLLAGDKTASVDLAEAYYAALIEYLRRKNSRRLPNDQLADAVYQTWESLCKNPRTFNGSTSLWSFLCMSAHRDLKNLLAKEQRRARHENPSESVELWPDDGNVENSEDDRITLAHEIAAYAAVGLTEPERACLTLYLDGQRKTAAFAAALGIGQEPMADQRKIVKRIKDRLIKRIERARRDRVGRDNGDAP